MVLALPTWWAVAVAACCMGITALVALAVAAAQARGRG
jgi:hypothetical protein